jgi:SOS response regulatory protein OraA/RecX
VVVTDEIMEAALRRLAATDDLSAELHTKLERAEFKAKAVKDAVFMRAQGSVAERQALAGTAAEYEVAMEDYFQALQAHEGLRNERARKIIVIEVWRSLNSARNKGLL